MSDSDPSRDDTRRTMRALSGIDARTWLLILALFGGGGSGAAAMLARFVPPADAQERLKEAEAKLEAVDHEWRLGVDAKLDAHAKKMARLERLTAGIAAKLHVKDEEE